MGHIISYLNISLDKPVLKSLETFTSLGIDEVISIQKSMILVSFNSQMLSYAKADKILKGFFKNHSLLSEAFAASVGAENELKIHINTLICSLCIFSHGSWKAKLRCKIYLGIFNLYTKYEGNSLDVERLERLLKDVIKGICTMTGTGFPDGHCYVLLAERMMEVAARQTVDHLNLNEFTNLIHSSPELMKLLKPRKSSTYTGLRMSTFELRHIQAKVVAKKTAHISFEKSTGKLPSVTSVLQSPTLSRKFPIAQTPISVSRMKRSKTELKPLGVFSDFKRKFKIQNEDKPDSQTDKTSYTPSYSSPDFRRLNTKSRTSLIAKVSESVNEIPIKSNSRQDNSKLSKQILSHQELEIFARLFAIGDVDGKGWDKSDVMEMIGKKSYENACYIIQKYSVSSSNRLKFSDYLRISLPESKEFDASRVNEFYPIYRAQKL